MSHFFLDNLRELSERNSIIQRKPIFLPLKESCRPQSVLVFSATDVYSMQVVQNVRLCVSAMLIAFVRIVSLLFYIYSIRKRAVHCLLLNLHVYSFCSHILPVY